MKTFFQSVEQNDKIISNINGEGTVKNKYIDSAGCYVIEVFYLEPTKIYRYNMNGINFNYIDKIIKG